MLMFITVPFQVRSITDEIKPIKSGSVFFKSTPSRLALYLVLSRIAVFGKFANWTRYTSDKSEF